MNLLEQCRLWTESGEAQRTVEALEKLAPGERTPELDSELAGAYLAAAGAGDRELFEKALELLEPHEDDCRKDYRWNCRIASAYFHLGEEGPALHYFEKALEAKPGDEDAQRFIDDCRKRLALPLFEKNFRERTQEAWDAFASIEAELRAIMEEDELRERSGELLGKAGGALRIALRDCAFELGFSGEKYELILSPEGFRSRLFSLVYFQHRAPESVLEHWIVRVGRQSSAGSSLRADGAEIGAQDVRVWAKKTETHQVELTLFCEKLLPMLREDPDRAWWFLSTLVDQTLGEISAIALIGSFDVCTEPQDGPSLSLAELPLELQRMGLTLWDDAAEYLDATYLTYEFTPVEDPEADWRLDVFTGVCRLPSLLNDYMTARSGTADDFHREGTAAGFLCYPLSGFSGEDAAARMLEFRDALQSSIQKEAGDDAVTFLGGATGLYAGYLDFLAWDLPAVLDAAQSFFEKSGLPWAQFHAFRRNVGGVPLLGEEEIEPDIDEETGSLLSAKDIELLRSFEDGTGGSCGSMVQWLEDFVRQGVAEKRFTEEQARQDLRIALWFCYACNNLDDYLYSYRAAQWMKFSEEKAKGCGVWYYRYSVALMYCGRLGEALDYAERGAREEPGYPWIWLELGKLRAHFGDRNGALEAVARGLALEPDNFEFLTLRDEIEAGAALEQMEYHRISPEADAALQAGNDRDQEQKRRAIACIAVDEAGLSAFRTLFEPDRYGYEKDAPFCSLTYPAAEHPIELSFHMNEAGLSKLGADWLFLLKEQLDGGEWLTSRPEDGPQGALEAVFVSQTQCVCLAYRQPEDGETFQLFLGPDFLPGTAARFFGVPEPGDAGEL